MLSSCRGLCKWHYHFIVDGYAFFSLLLLLHLLIFSLSTDIPQKLRSHLVFFIKYERWKKKYQNQMTTSCWLLLWKSTIYNEAFDGQSHNYKLLSQSKAPHKVDLPNDCSNNQNRNFSFSLCSGLIDGIFTEFIFMKRFFLYDKLFRKCGKENVKICGFINSVNQFFLVKNFTRSL